MSQHDLVQEENLVLESLCEELEGLFQNYIQDLDSLWESLRTQLESSLHSFVESKSAALPALQRVREEHSHYSEQHSSAQSFLAQFAHVIS